MDTEWQILLKNQAAKVLPSEETARVRERWPDRAMDARWARIWQPDDNEASGSQAKSRLIMKGLTDPDLLDIESHSPTLTGEGVLAVLQAVCSHGHKLQFGDVQEAFNTGDPTKKQQRLFGHIPPDGVPGEPRDVWDTVARDSERTGRWHARMEKIFPCSLQRAGL